LQRFLKLFRQSTFILAKKDAILPLIGFFFFKVLI